jgi:hypothetical protein
MDLALKFEIKITLHSVLPMNKMTEKMIVWFT